MGILQELKDGSKLKRNERNHYFMEGEEPSLTKRHSLITVGVFFYTFYNKFPSLIEAISSLMYIDFISGVSSSKGVNPSSSI